MTALHFAIQRHDKQYRKDGAPYITHPISVLKRIAELGLPECYQKAAVLHDVIEDCGVSPKELEKYFGKRTSLLVQFLTKYKKTKFSKTWLGHKIHLWAYLYKLRCGFKKHPSLMLVKMADQIHNLKTIKVFKKYKQERIKNEIRDYFIPMYTKYQKLLKNGLNRKFDQLILEMEELV